MRPTAPCVVSALCLALAHPADAQTPPSDRAAQRDVVRPFGPGQPVEVACSEPDGVVFVARGALPAEHTSPDPFVQVGSAPARFELPAGVYTVLVESDRFTSASTVFEVRHQPVHVRVDAGSQDLRDLSTLLIALGSSALLAGAVLEVSGTGEGDSSKKRKLTIPLFIGGGVAFAGGLGLYFASDSSIEHDGYVAPSRSGQPVRSFGIVGRF